MISSSFPGLFPVAAKLKTHGRQELVLEIRLAA
jgi:hypothetical protein